MAQYEQLKLSIVLFESDDVITASLGDNEVPELGGETGNGGIWG